MSHPFGLTIILAFILLGFGGYVYFVDVPASEQAIQVKKEERRLIPFDDRLVTQFTLKSPKEHLVFDRDERGRWLITTPLVAPADAREVRKILRALTLGKIERVHSRAGYRFGTIRTSASTYDGDYHGWQGKRHA